MSAKTDKKKKKMQERLAQLEGELLQAITKKAHDTEIDVPTYTRRIQELREQLRKM